MQGWQSIAHPRLLLRWSDGQLTTSIFVPVLADQRERLQQRLEELKQEGEYVFPGTAARYIIWSKTHPGALEILLIWRSTTMPEEADRAEALAEFQQALADVLDWVTARYDNRQVLIHTQDTDKVKYRGRRGGRVCKLP